MFPTALSESTGAISAAAYDSKLNEESDTNIKFTLSFILRPPSSLAPSLVQIQEARGAYQSLMRHLWDVATVTGVFALGSR